jgi:hypothetical protein
MKNIGNSNQLQADSSLFELTLSILFRKIVSAATHNAKLYINAVAK